LKHARKNARAELVTEAFKWRAVSWKLVAGSWKLVAGSW
jgi:hypothetical protein